MRNAPEGALAETAGQVVTESVPHTTDEAPLRRVLRMISAPIAGATGRCVQTVASHASMAAIVALRLVLATYRPRECFNANGDPKVRHKSREDAIKQKRALILAGRASKWLQVYQCKYCGSWHVGHRGGRRG
jgi:hypothetical protein